MDTNFDDNWFDLCLAKATNPLSNDNNNQNLELLIDCLMQKKECIPITLQFLAHKIQSPQELESIKALHVLEHLVNRCDYKFIQEVAKFRFLNELIKVVSPKYLAHRSPKKSREKIIELLFRWTIELKNEPKIFEAYQMLKKQGLITQDPIHALNKIKPTEPPTPRPKDEVWDKEENALTLQRLIQSQNPEDLITANKMIKLLAQEVDKKVALKERCKFELEIVYNNTRIFSDVLNYYQPKKSSAKEIELLKDLNENCEKLRPQLFRLAADLDQNDPLLNDILTANEELTQVINEYKSKFNLISNKPLISFKSSQTNQASNLLDFNSSNQQSTIDDNFTNKSLVNTLNILSNNNQSNKFKSIDDLLDSSSSSNVSMPVQAELKNQTSSKSQTLSTLDELEAFMRESFYISQKASSPSNKMSLNDLKAKEDSNSIGNKSLSIKEDDQEALKSNYVQLPPPLVDLFVPLDSIKLSSRPSILLNDENGVRTILNYGQNVPREDVAVFVITSINTNKKPVNKLFFQAVAPKGTRIKLQAPSATNLSPYNSFLSPSAITQVLLLSRLFKNSSKIVSLEYSIEYVVDSINFSKKGSIQLSLD